MHYMDMISALQGKYLDIIREHVRIFEIIDADKALTLEDKQALLKELLIFFPQNEMTTGMVRSVEKESSRGDSFVSSLITFRKIKEQLRLLGFNVALGQNYKTKQQDRNFAAQLGVKVPRIYQDEVHFNSIALKPSTVIKPCRGSSGLGVFVVGEDLSLRSVRKGLVYREKEEILSEVAGYKSKISFDEWCVEELIVLNKRPANEFKVYFFYGFPALFLEIDRSCSTK